MFVRHIGALRQKYGFEVVKLPFSSIVPYMDQIKDEEARPIAEKIIRGANDVKVNTDWFINDIKYYLAAKKMMDRIAAAGWRVPKYIDPETYTP